MKLYYSPGACSLSPHIVLRESGTPFELERVDLAKKTTASGTDFRTVNPKGYVPALQLDGGEVLTEGPAIVQYIAEQAGSALLPPAGSLARTRVQENLNFIGTEVHKSFSPLFSPASSDEMKAAAKANVARRFDDVEKILGDGRDYLTGDDFSVADIYLFVVSSWSQHVGIALDKWPRLVAFVARVGARPAVQAALKAEGLLR